MDRDNGTATKKPNSTAHDIITGGIEGGVGVLALEPALEALSGKTVTNPLRGGAVAVAKRVGTAGLIGAGATGLIGALVSVTAKKHKERKAANFQELRDQRGFENLRPGMIEFRAMDNDDFPRVAPKRRPLVTAAGIGAIAAGGALAPAAAKILKISGRGVAKGLGNAEAGRNVGGKLVADYIGAAQSGLNTGLKGKAVGGVIEHILHNPESPVTKAFAKANYGSNELGPRLAGEHFARFRASPMHALGFWDFEHSMLHEGKFNARMAAAKEGGRDTAKIEARRQRQLDEMHYGREEAHRQIKEQIEVHGKNEMDAIKHVAYNSDHPQVQHYFDELAASKAGAVAKYTNMALASPAMIAAGGVAVAAGRKKNESPRDALKRSVRALEALEPGMIEFDYDPYSDRSLRAGVRLDKYEKTIRAREIDRHLHNYVTSAAIGAAAGAVIPAPQSLKKRVLAGAGSGVLVAGVLHAGGHKDAYGEQSEDAKVIQRNAPKYIGAAAVVGGLLARYRNKRNAMFRVVKSV
jgi:hypothetical protein